MNKKAFFGILPSWGGGHYIGKKHGPIRGTAGYDYLLGTVPIPDVGVRFGGKNSDTEYSISGPIPGVGIAGALPKDYHGWTPSHPRSLWKVLGDKAKGISREESEDKTTEKILNNYIRNFKDKDDKGKRMNKKSSYINGFVKAAMENGFTEGQAIDLCKTAESSFLGRYLAAHHVPHSTFANNRQIMDDIDPTGEYQNKNLGIWGQKYKDRRQKAYDYMLPTIKRELSGTMLKNILLGGGLGALTGGIARGPIGALVGANVGALGGATAKVLNNYEKRKITQEDIDRMKKQQLRRGIASEFLPGRDIWDALRA